MIKQVLLNFHKKIEKFFEARARNNNPLLAILIFLIPVVALSFIFSFPDVQGITFDERISIAAQNSEVFTGKFLSILPLMVIIFATYAFGFLLAGQKIFKGKANWKQILYLWGICLLVLSAGLYTALFLQSLIILIVFALLFIYLSAAAMKAAHKIYFGWAFLLLIGAYIAGQILQLVLIVAYFNLFVVPNLKAESTDTMFSFSVVNNSDGSITASYARLSNKTGKIKEICNVSFPEGWGYGDPVIIKELIKKEQNKEAEYYDDYKVFYKLNYTKQIEEYLVFEYAPPLTLSISFDKSTYERKNIEPLRETIIFDMKKSTGTKYLDIKYRDENKTTNRHKIDVKSAVNIGYTAVYQSPYNQDQDLYYIINSTSCYKYY